MEPPARVPSPTIGELGESAVLGRILPRLSPGDAAHLGAGDDAAVVAAPDGRFVVTTDLMVHGPDFRLAWSTPFDLGWKAAATNLTDVAAMGARPTALVVAIAARRRSASRCWKESRTDSARASPDWRRARAWSAATSRPRPCS
jgi:thiamine-monophosphate kinase